MLENPSFPPSPSSLPPPALPPDAEGHADGHADGHTDGHRDGHSAPLPILKDAAAGDFSEPHSSGGRFCTADSLEVGCVARVVRVSARCSELRHKLLSLGVVAGTKLEVTAVAPLRDPMNVRLLGFTLSLRLCEASCITVEKI